MSGDRVATLAFNHYQHLELYYAIPGIGVVCHSTPHQMPYTFVPVKEIPKTRVGKFDKKVMCHLYAEGKL